MRSALPIRWRLALLIAGVTTLVLIIFAVTVGTLTSARLRTDFEQSVARTSADLADRIRPQFTRTPDGDYRFESLDFNVSVFARGSAGIVRVVTSGGAEVENTSDGVPLGPAQTGRRQIGDHLVDTRPLASREATVSGETFFVQYARPTGDRDATIRQIWLLLVIGTLAGSAASLAGASWIAGRALRPVSELTSTATAIAQTGDGSRRLPIPRRRDELAELARTLDTMLESLDAARTTTESTLAGQREFLADASHELRTPLTSVITNLEMLADTDDPDVAETAAAALGSARRMRGLVADLLDLARADAPADVRRDPVDLAEVVDDALHEVEQLLTGHHVDVEAAPVKVLGQRDALQRVVRNLLENAASHTPPGTNVKVTVRRRGLHAALAVEDDGPGIPAPVRGRAFERFVRSGSRTGNSSGLGLSIVRASAQAHGGWVELRSPIAGRRGTRVEIRLPLPD